MGGCQSATSHIQSSGSPADLEKIKGFVNDILNSSVAEHSKAGALAAIAGELLFLDDLGVELPKMPNAHQGTKQEEQIAEVQALVDDAINALRLNKHRGATGTLKQQVAKMLIEKARPRKNAELHAIPADMRAYTFQYLNQHHTTTPLTGLGSGDSYLLLDVVEPEKSASAMSDLLNGLQWSEMTLKGRKAARLVCVQGEIQADGSQPVYRHPVDEEPPLHDMQPEIKELRDLVAAKTGQPFNHVLIQHYRSGKDFIAGHADKTVDVVRRAASHASHVSRCLSCLVVPHVSRRCRARRSPTSPSARRG